MRPITLWQAISNAIILNKILGAFSWLILVLNYGIRLRFVGAFKSIMNKLWYLEEAIQESRIKLLLYYWMLMIKRYFNILVLKKLKILKDLKFSLVNHFYMEIMFTQSEMNIIWNIDACKDMLLIKKSGRLFFDFKIILY